AVRRGARRRRGRARTGRRRRRGRRAARRVRRARRPAAAVALRPRVRRAAPRPGARARRVRALPRVVRRRRRAGGRRRGRAGCAGRPGGVRYRRDDGGGAMTGAPRTLAETLGAGLHRAMTDDDRVVVMGEDVGRLGGVYRVTDGLQAEFGERRVLDTPLAESGIIGTAVGLAYRGYRPVCE